MNTGKKIQIIRKFRKMRQEELGELIGLEGGIQPRIAQYETGYRMPGDEILQKIAEALNVNPLAIRPVQGTNAEELMQIFFWLEEEKPGVIHPFQLTRFPNERCNDSDDVNIYYHDNDSWPAKNPCGFWLDYGILNDFIREWIYHQQELSEGKISREEYFEWKINWPYTCDDCGKREPKFSWRKPKEETENESEDKPKSKTARKKK